MVTSSPSRFPQQLLPSRWSPSCRSRKPANTHEFRSLGGAGLSLPLAFPTGSSRPKADAGDPGIMPPNCLMIPGSFFNLRFSRRVLRTSCLLPKAPPRSSTGLAP
ncbi:protein of unknown function [Hyphomicrobium sp. MC1]|nr:protein of unknown function [Hyphomicrobium sp. MC1]